MAFETPSLPELITRAKDDLQADALQQSDAQILGRAHAGAIYGLYGYVKWVARQALPDQADEETLERMAGLRIGGRKPASPAHGKVTVTGVDGVQVPDGVLLQAQNGQHFAIVTSAVIHNGTATVSIVAVEAGAASNLPAETKLRFVSPVASINDEVTALAPGISGGADLETTESLRQRVIRSWRVVPHGGSVDDYVTWATQVSGVTRAWAIRHYMGAGTVGVFCVRDDESPITPDEEELATIKAHIERLKPVTAEVYVLAPKIKTQRFTIKVMPDNPAVRHNVEEALKNLIRNEATMGGTLYISRIRAAVSGAVGEENNIVISPTADVKTAKTELVVYGGVEWQMD